MSRAWLRHLCTFIILTFAQSSRATTITVNFETAFVPGGGEQALPIYVNNSDPNPDSVRLRFSVPSAALIDSLNSVRVSFDVYDDDDGANNETGDVVFLLNGIGQPNFVVTSFDAGLNGTTAAGPLTVGALVNPTDFGNLLAEIQDDGIFFVRLNRTGGDYFVQDGTVTIDANVVPEPATLSLLCVAVVIGITVRAPRLGHILTCGSRINSTHFRFSHQTTGFDWQGDSH